MRLVSLRLSTVDASTLLGAEEAALASRIAASWRVVGAATAERAKLDALSNEGESPLFINRLSPIS